MITVDFETRSRCDLRKCGSSVYARHESTEVLCLAWSLAGSEVQLWTPGDLIPESLFALIQRGELVEAHNVGFERQIWHHVCHKRMGWPDVSFDQWRCSMAACCRLSLPRSLDAAGAALDLPVRKNDAGHKIMLRLSKPKKPSMKDPGEWDNDPAKFEKLYRYCEQDVRSEAAISDAIPGLTASELRVWQLDQRINLRGLQVDTVAVHNSLEIVQQTYSECCTQINELTNGEVSTPKQVQAIREWIEETTGEVLPDLSKDTVSAYLANPQHDTTRQILELRQQASKASTAKLDALIARCDADGRVRGNLVYHGASTGRWSGSGIQIQNFPRGTLSPSEIELVHRVLPTKSSRRLDLLLGLPIDCISSSLRSMITAAPGKRLLVCDFASIEARVLAWIAHQDDLVAQFRVGDDVYVSMASKIYDHPEADITKQQRHIGKTAILGCGYGMGHKAFRSACKIMGGVEIDTKFAKQVIKAYRESNDQIRKFWGDINTAAIRTIQTGAPHRIGRLQLTCDGEWLRIGLPSGRQLHYRNPRLVEVVAPWSQGYEGTIQATEDHQETLESLDIELGDRMTGAWIGCSVPRGVKSQLDQLKIRYSLKPKEPQYIKQIEYWEVNSKTRKWARTRTYGGKLTENIVQAIARDFLVESMLRVEAAGYPIVATVHDEILCELETNKGSLDEFEQLMRQVPRWGAGCPIEVEGFEANRYRK